MKPHAWSFLKTFKKPSHVGRKLPTWELFQNLNRAGSSALTEKLKGLPLLLQEWNEKLAPLGGDPCFRNWDTFRPMRLGREEDWSDWLAYLLQESRTGKTASNLFGIPEVTVTSMLREETTLSGERRADIVLAVSTGDVVHLEVKLGDHHIEGSVIWSV